MHKKVAVGSLTIGWVLSYSKSVNELIVVIVIVIVALLHIHTSSSLYILYIIHHTIILVVSAVSGQHRQSPGYPANSTLFLTNEVLVPSGWIYFMKSTR